MKPTFYVLVIAGVVFDVWFTVRHLNRQNYLLAGIGAALLFAILATAVRSVRSSRPSGQ